MSALEHGTYAVHDDKQWRGRAASTRD